MDETGDAALCRVIKKCRLEGDEIFSTFYLEFQEQYQLLITYIDHSFQKDANGHYINNVTKAVYGKNDAFYEANGSYSLLFTCNTWANEGLKSCGQKSCLCTPFDKGIFLKY